MYIIYIFIFALIIMITYMIIETKLLKIENIKISANNNPIKIAQISDIHIKNMNVPLEKIQKALKTENPDIIILTGDYIENSRDIPKFLTFLNTLPDKPIFACFGNHDYKAFLKNTKDLKEFAQLIEQKNVKMLRNSNLCVNIKNRKINLLGIEDIRYKKHDLKAAFNNLDCEADTTIAFSHNPDIIFSLPPKTADILLSGHFHGGQIWVPFHIEFKLMRKEKLSKMKVYKGLNTVNDQRLYISRGIGNVVFPFRFLSMPEITIFEL